MILKPRWQNIKIVLETMIDICTFFLKLLFFSTQQKPFRKEDEGRNYLYNKYNSKLLKRVVTFVINEYDSSPLPPQFPTYQVPECFVTEDTLAQNNNSMEHWQKVRKIYGTLRKLTMIVFLMCQYSLVLVLGRCHRWHQEACLCNM